MAGRRLDRTRPTGAVALPAGSEDVVILEIIVPDDGVDAWAVAFGSSVDPATPFVKLSIAVNGNKQENYRDVIPEIGLVPIPYPLRIKVHAMDRVQVLASNTDPLNPFNVNARLIIEL